MKYVTPKAVVAAIVLAAIIGRDDAACAQSLRSDGVYRANILDYGPDNLPVDRTGSADDSAALANAIDAANIHTAAGRPACVYIPAGVYRIVSRPPSFALAGCVKGDGSSQSFIKIDPQFSGDLFTWSEAWAGTTPGPRIVGLTVQGSAVTAAIQNAFVLFDRNDQVFMEDVSVNNLYGRALYSGVTKHAATAYMRESHLISLHFFNDGAPGIPVVEFSSEAPAGSKNSNVPPDATNEVRMSLVDIYGARGPSLVIRNNGAGAVRNITLNGLRVEGLEQDVFGPSQGDLVTIGDPAMTGNVNNIRLTDVELMDPDEGDCALRMTAPPNQTAPYQVTVQGLIGGGMPYGRGLCIDAGRASVFRLSGIYTFDTNVEVGAAVGQIVLDGGGLERLWTYSIKSTVPNAVRFPVLSSQPPP